MDFSKISFWIQIHCLPLDLLSIKNARTIGSNLGELLEVEDPFEDKIGRGFLRVKVRIDTQKPLIETFRIPKEEGGHIMARLKYENLQDYCYACGKLGHVITSCPEIGKKGFKPVNYESDLRTTAIRYVAVVNRRELAKVWRPKIKSTSNSDDVVKSTGSSQDRLKEEEKRLKKEMMENSLADIGETSQASEEREGEEEEGDCGLPSDDELELLLRKEESVKIGQMMDELTKEWMNIGEESMQKNQSNKVLPLSSKIDDSVKAASMNDCPYTVEMPDEYDYNVVSLANAMKFALARMAFGVNNISLKRKGPAGVVEFADAAEEEEVKAVKRRRTTIWDGSALVEMVVTNKGLREVHVDRIGIGDRDNKGWMTFNAGKSLEVVKPNVRSFRRRKMVHNRWLNNVEIDIFSCKGDSEVDLGYGGWPAAATKER